MTNNRIDIEPVYFDEHASLKIDKAKKVTIPKEQMEAFEDALDPDLALSTRIKRLLAGKTKTSKWIGTGLDIIIALSPVTKPVNRLRRLVKREVEPKTNQKPMLGKISSIANFINLRDENGDFDPVELVASVLQIVIAGAVVWGASELGIWAELSELFGK